MPLNNFNCQLREVLPSDCETLFFWRNKEHVRLVMHSTEKILYDAHKKWFQNMLNDPDKRYYIFEQNQKPLGIVNFSGFNIEKNAAVWGFYLGEENTPRGIGTLMCELALKMAKEALDLCVVHATVKAENARSIYLHEKLGFKKIKEEGAILFYRKELKLENENWKENSW